MASRWQRLNARASPFTSEEMVSSPALFLLPFYLQATKPQSVKLVSG